MRSRRPFAFRRLAALCLPVATAAALLVACGGSGDDGHGPEITGSSLCDVPSQKNWLRAHMADRYYWSGLSPNPDPQGYATVDDYFQSLLFTGDGTVPADRWSYIEGAAQFNQFFGAGRTVGYGVSVNGLELQLPLKVRFVEARSPAATAGLVRGDTLVSANGRSAADLVAANDFAAFAASRAGDVLTLVIDRGGVQQTVSVTSAVFDLTPVTAPTVFNLPGGRKAGYLVMKDFIGQAETPLADALASFRAQNASELILDLRYNGGGLISTSTRLASLVTGDAHDGEAFVRLRYNPRRPRADFTYSLASIPNAARFTRVVVLTGPRTCSASELVVNGLKPYVDVVTVGGTTCGKPVGFTPVNSCGNVFSAVNFESVNAAGQGGYYAGIAPTCTVADDFERPLGNAGETLTAAALSYLENGQCPVGAGRPDARVLRAPSGAAQSTPVLRGKEPGTRPGMWAD
jgi:carboxyl-terminal processing protease